MCKQLLPIITKQMNVAITTDASDYNGNSFICVTAHYITKEWKMIDMCLSVHEGNESHDNKVIAALLHKTCDAWNLNNKVHAIVTDYGRNFTSAVVTFNRTRLCADNIRCACHGCNLCVQNCLKSNKDKDYDVQFIEDLLRQCRRVVTKIKKSPTNLRPLMLRMQAEVQSDETSGSAYSSNEKTVKIDNDTRWNSTLRMITGIRHCLCRSMQSLERAIHQMKHLVKTIFLY